MSTSPKSTPQTCFFLLFWNFSIDDKKQVRHGNLCKNKSICRNICFVPPQKDTIRLCHLLTLIGWGLEKGAGREC